MRRLHHNAIDVIERQRLQHEDRLSIGSGYTWWTLFLRRVILEYSAAHPEAPINVNTRQLAADAWTSSSPAISCFSSVTGLRIWRVEHMLISFRLG